MSEADAGRGAMNSNLRAAFMAIAQLDGCTVSVEDDGDRLVVECTDHDGDYEIDAGPVHDAVREHGCVVASSGSDFRADRHIVEVTV